MIPNEKGVCECQKGYLYNSSTDDCFNSYSQDPCALGKIFLLPAHEKNTTCVENETQLVKNRINLFGSIASIIKAPEIVTEAPKQCKPGTQRTATGHCKHSL